MDEIEILSDKLHEAKNKIKLIKSDQEAHRSQIERLLDESKMMQHKIDMEQQYCDILTKQMVALELADNQKGDHVQQTAASY
jgi:hypothetical protein